MNTLKKESMRKKLIAFAFFSVLSLGLFKLTLQAQAPKDDNVNLCSTYCYWWNPNYNCVITDTEGGWSITCHFRHPYLGG